MNLQELSDAFNALRNDALGRGTQPLVSAALATKVGNTVDRFKNYLSGASVLDDITADATAHGWVDEYRSLATAVKAEGIKLTAPLPTTFGEVVATTATATAHFAQTAIIVLAAVGVPLLYLMMGGGRRRA